MNKKSELLLLTPLVLAIIVFGFLYGGTAGAFGFAFGELLAFLGFAVVTELVGLVYLWLMKKKSTIKLKVGLCSIVLVTYWIATNQLNIGLILILLAYIITRLFWDHFGVTPKFLRF